MRVDLVNRPSTRGFTHLKAGTPLQPIHAAARLERARCQAAPRGCRPVSAARQLDGSDARCQIPAVRARGIGVSWISSTPGRSVTIGCILLLSFRRLGRAVAGGVAGRAPSRIDTGATHFDAVVVPWVSVEPVVRSAPRTPLPSRTARPPWPFSSSDISSSASGIIYDPRCGAVADHVATLGLAAARTPRGRPGRLRTVNNLPAASPVRQLQVRPCWRPHHGERHRAVVRRPSTRQLDQSRPRLTSGRASGA